MIHTRSGISYSEFKKFEYVIIIKINLLLVLILVNISYLSNLSNINYLGINIHLTQFFSVEPPLEPHAKLYISLGPFKKYTRYGKVFRNIIYLMSPEFLRKPQNKERKT